MNNKSNARVFGYKFANVYPLYVEKAERKNRTKEEVDQIICWLTGYTRAGLQQQMKQGNDLETFFAQAPAMNPNSSMNWQKEKQWRRFCGRRSLRHEKRPQQRLCNTSSRFFGSVLFLCKGGFSFCRCFGFVKVLFGCNLFWRLRKFWLWVKSYKMGLLLVLSRENRRSVRPTMRAADGG
jgi:hypothetical protein